MITIKTVKHHKGPKTKHHKSGPCDSYGTIFQVLLCVCVENIDIHPSFHLRL